MNERRDPVSPPGSASDCTGFRRALRHCEHACGASPPASSGAHDDLRGLCEHLRRCPPCTARYGARVRALEGRRALNERDLPDGTFDGFYAAVRERMPLAPPGGGMSLAFLNAPRSLRIWRSAALAAGLLLILGTGFVLTRNHASDQATDNARPLHDPRIHLLEALGTVPATKPAGLRTWPVHAPPPRGHEDFFQHDAEPVGVEVTPARKARWK